MNDFKEITEKILKFRDKRNWKQFHNPKDLAINLNIESSELLELYLWKNEKEVNEVNEVKDADTDADADVDYDYVYINWAPIDCANINPIKVPRIVFTGTVEDQLNKFKRVKKKISAYKIELR